MNKKIQLQCFIILFLISCKTRNDAYFYHSKNDGFISKINSNAKIRIQEDDRVKIKIKDSFNIYYNKLNNNSFKEYILDTIKDYFKNEKTVKFHQQNKYSFEICLDSLLIKFDISKTNKNSTKNIYKNYFNNSIFYDKNSLKVIDYRLNDVFFESNNKLFIDIFLNNSEITELNPFKDVTEIAFYIDRLNESGDYNKASQIINKFYSFKAKKIKNNQSIEKILPISFDKEFYNLKDCKILLINDYHFFETSRYSTLYLLNKLSKHGFNHLLAEDYFSNKNLSLRDLKPNEIEGYYLKQPTYGLLTDYAFKNNIKLHGYDYYDSCQNQSLNNQKCRDSMQAVKIKKIIENYPNSKFIVFGGHGHTFYNYDNVKPMGQYLKELFPEEKIISLNQLYYIDSFGVEQSIFKLLNSKYNIKEPALIKETNTHFDYTIIQPNNKIGYWYYQKSDLMSKKIRIKKKKGYYIEIVSYDTNITVYKGKTAELLNENIYLPKGNYNVIYFDKFYNKI